MSVAERSIKGWMLRSVLSWLLRLLAVTVLLLTLFTVLTPPGRTGFRTALFVL